MPHNYVKDPPKYATDAWAWDHTRNKVEESSGKDYDEWEQKQFMAAGAIYKSVVKKYSYARQEGRLDPARECADCGDLAVHYQDDYICSKCRDMLEEKNSGEVVLKAQASVASPSADDAERALAQALAKLQGESPEPDPFASLGRRPVRPAAPVTSPLVVPQAKGKVSRNYKAMGIDKLTRSIRELEAQSGEAYEKIANSGELCADHLLVARKVAKEKFGI